MFHSARIKLSAWYLLIIMLVSISFSIAIYEVISSELNRVERMQRSRVERGLPERFRAPPFNFGDDSIRPLFLDHQLIEETKNRLKLILGTVNLIILGTSTLSGYFLAGRTLKPIKEMVDQQGRFITDVSHELRTPLTSLKSEIEVTLRDKRLSLNKAKKLLASNLEEVNNLQTLSDGLIRLTQYQKGNNGLEVTDISLSAIAVEAIKKVAGLAKAKHISIENKVGNHSLEGNKQTLVELLIIFLDNAIKYSPEKTAISLTSEKSDGHILINISDQGIGIEGKDIPHLFDRFFRIDKSRTKADAPGYGLGLSIAKQIVERHNGSIKVKSKMEEGTTFTVELPIKHSSKLI